ncbi:MAG: phasin family protein [Gammaproteobacteria bacterium]
MTDFNEQFDRFAELQQQAFEPARAFGAVAADAFERFARQNYAVMGDCMEFAVDQARLAGDADDVNDYVTRQTERNRVFGEKLAARAQEFTAIATATQNAATEVATKEAKKVKTAVGTKKK